MQCKCLQCFDAVSWGQEEHPACKNWVVGCWRGYLSAARCRLAYWPSWCYCHSLSLASVKSRLVYLSGTGWPGKPRVYLWQWQVRCRWAAEGQSYRILFCGIYLSPECTLKFFFGKRSHGKGPLNVCIYVTSNMCSEYAENELQRHWTAIIILILFS